ncbi:MAG: hypothetical protein U1E73_03590 [Planctomycetota bacterium]
MKKNPIVSPLIPMLAMLACTASATGQCGPILVSGGPIATLRGQVLSSVLWDTDGAGPLPPWLVVGGHGLTGGDQATPVALMAHDGTQWRGLGFDNDDFVNALGVYNGELIAGGSFTLTTVSGNANSIARLNGGTWQRLGSGIMGSGGVLALKEFGSELYAGGTFGSMGGSQTGPIARWNGTQWAALTSAQQPTPPSGSVTTLEVMGSLYVGGGSFTFGVGSTGAGQGIGRWDGAAWTSAAFVTNSSGTPIITSLSAINGASHATSFLFAAGAFTAVGGASATNVVRAPYSANSWSSMSGSSLSGLSGIKLLARTPFQGTPEVFATGSPTTGVPRARLWTGTSWIQLGNLGPATASVAGTAPQYYGGYVAGIADPAASPRSTSMFRYLGDWAPLWGAGFLSPVRCLAFDGADAIAGGAFWTVDNTIVNGIARRVGATWTAMGSGVAGGSATVRAVASAGNGVVFAGGDFTTAGVAAASNVARWDGAAWAPLGTGANGTVLALLVASNGDVIAGGDFTSVGGVACNHIARWNGTTWSPLASGVDNSVRCLVALANGDVVAGGTFVQAGGVTCNRIARWNGNIWSAMAGGMDADVDALAVRPNGDVVAGGAFTTAGGNPTSRLARLHGSAWTSLGPGVTDTADALAVLPDGDVLVGGAFAGGATNFLARWDSHSDTIGGIGTGLGGPDVFAMAVAPNGEVFIGGDFDKILPNTASGHLAVLSTTCPASVTAVATACVGPSGPVVLVADSMPWLGTTFRSTAAGFAPQALAVSVLGFTPNNLPLSLVLPVGLPNCNLLASSDAVLLTLPQAGTSHYQFAVPESPVFAGVPLSHQFVQLALSTSGAITSLSSSNALTLVLGIL